METHRRVTNPLSPNLSEPMNEEAESTKRHRTMLERLEEGANPRIKQAYYEKNINADQQSIKNDFFDPKRRSKAFFS